MRYLQYNDDLLRKVLCGNAIFSVLSGAFCVAAAGWLAQAMFAGPVSVFGIPVEIVIMELGVALFLFAGFVWWTARARPVRMTAAKIILAADVAWVVGSIVLLVAAYDLFTGTGIALIVGTAIIVDIFAMEEAATMGLFAGRRTAVGH